MRRQVLDQMELLRHRTFVCMGLEEKVILDLGPGENDT